jgi:hypothetical protein
MATINKTSRKLLTVAGCRLALAAASLVAGSCAHSIVPPIPPEPTRVEHVRVIVEGRPVALSAALLQMEGHIYVPLHELLDKIDRVEGRSEVAIDGVGKPATHDGAGDLVVDGDPIPLANKNYGPFDAAGVPTKDYGGSIGIQYNPLVVAEYGEAHFHRYLSHGDEREKAALFRMAEWLVANLEPMSNHPDAGVWYYRFDWLPYNRAPWISGLTQAHGMEVLLNAYLVSGSARYLDAARRAFAVLAVPADEGGGLVHDTGGRMFIEENPTVPPSRIFPGFASILISAYPYNHLAGVAEAAVLSAKVPHRSRRCFHCTTPPSHSTRSTISMHPRCFAL